MASDASSRSTRRQACRAASARVSRELRRGGFERRGKLARSLFASASRRSLECSTAARSARDLIEKREHLFDRRAVFALQLFERGQARFHFIQTPRIGFELAEIVTQGVRGFIDGDGGGLAARRSLRSTLSSIRASFLQTLRRRTAIARARSPGLRRAPRRRRSRFPQGAPRCAERGARFQARRLRPAAARRPRFRCAGRSTDRPAAAFPARCGRVLRAPASRRASAVDAPRLRERIVRARERVQHLALDGGREELLLIVLAVDIAQEAAPDRAAAPRWRAGFRRSARDLPFARISRSTSSSSSSGSMPASSSSFAKRGRCSDLEDARDPRALRSAAHHFGRGAAAEQQAQRVHHDRFAAAGFARQQIQAAMEAHADALDDGVVFDRQLDQHSSSSTGIAHDYRRRRVRTAKIGWRPFVPKTLFMFFCSVRRSFTMKSGDGSGTRNRHSCWK